MLLRTHLQDLKEVTSNVHYENYRFRKLACFSADGPKGMTKWVVNKYTKIFKSVSLIALKGCSLRSIHYSRIYPIFKVSK